MTAYECFVESVRARGSNEDGSFEYIAGYQVIAKLVNTIRMADGSERTGSVHFGHNVVFPLREEANQLLGRIEDNHMEINLSHWTELGSDYRTREDIEQDWDSFALQEQTCGC